MEPDKWLDLLPAYAGEFQTWSAVLSAYQAGAPFTVSDSPDVVMTKTRMQIRKYRARLRYGSRLQYVREYYEWENE